jgi:hypothetical protein
LIEQVDPLLEKNGLLLLQPIEDGKGSKCDLSRRHRNECKKVKWNITKLTRPKKLGSAITYYRRYTLQSLLGLNEDDDGIKQAHL